MANSSSLETFEQIEERQRSEREATLAAWKEQRNEAERQVSLFETNLDNIDENRNA